MARVGRFASSIVDFLKNHPKWDSRIDEAPTKRPRNDTSTFLEPKDVDGVREGRDGHDVVREGS